ncbi:MAG: hypothetical protein DRP83_00565 [Planctomycetota bacterium]|nr:MAG: hypothetical protein DRP83_00565 [Planctomycetota bacterium]
MMTEAPLKKDDKVRTGFYARETQIVRLVVSVRKHDCEGGFLVKADGGEQCECCGYKGRETPELSSNWFSKVEE